MRSIIMLLLMATSIYAQAQTYHGWKLGLSGGPVHYWYYNKGIQEYENSYRDHGFLGPYFKENNQKIVNGYTLGICTERTFRRNWIFRTELAFSHQAQSYLESNYFSPVPLLNFTIHSWYNYIKLPVFIGYQVPLNKQKTFLLQVNQGLQFSFLQRYELIRKGRTAWPFQVLDTNGQSTQVMIESSEVERLYSNKFSQEINNELYSIEHRSTFTNWPYRRLLLGTITDIGIKGQLPLNIAGFEHWYYGASVRFEYDLLGTDATNNDRHQTSPFLGPYTYTNHKTHNIRLGLNFSLMYHFNRR